MTEFSATPQIAFRRTSTGRGFLCDSSVEIQESADREQGHFNVKITHFPRRARDLGLDVGRNHHLFVECGSMGITRNLPLGFVSAELRSAHTRGDRPNIRQPGCSGEFYGFIPQALVGLIGAAEFEGVR